MNNTLPNDFCEDGIIKELEYRKPMKPIVKLVSDYGVDFICPKCNQEQHYVNRYHYCPNCGQRLGW